MSGALVGMVLCAGLGTRMRPLTGFLPKPALPLLGLPAIRYALALLQGAGVRRAVVNLHHLPDEMERAARAAARAVGLRLEVSPEPVLAGTGGALREAGPLLRGASEILLLNGDTLFDADLPAALAAHRRSGALATMILAPLPPGGGYAAVETDGALAVRRIAGRGRDPLPPGGGPLSPWHFTGCHVLSPAILDLVPAQPHACDVNRNLYPALLDGRVRGHLDPGAWCDLGSPAGYLAAHLDLLAGRFAGGRFPGADPFAGLEEGAPGVWTGAEVEVEPGAVLRAPVLLGAGTRVEAGARVGPGAAAGRACRIGAGAVVEEAVLWDGTALPPGARLERAIAAGELLVPAK